MAVASITIWGLTDVESIGMGLPMTFQWIKWSTSQQKHCGTWLWVYCSHHWFYVPEATGLRRGWDKLLMLLLRPQLGDSLWGWVMPQDAVCMSPINNHYDPDSSMGRTHLPRVRVGVVILSITFNDEGGKSVPPIPTTMGSVDLEVCSQWEMLLPGSTTWLPLIFKLPSIHFSSSHQDSS